MMTAVLHDLRYALRQLRNNRGFTSIAVVTLALGIGASTAMFGIMSAVLLRPLPFHDAPRLVRILSTQNGDVVGPSPVDVQDYAAENRTFEKIAVYDSWRKNVSLGGSVEAEQRLIGLVPDIYFEVLGIKLLMGRFFTTEENRWGNQFEAILSYEVWQTKFQGDSSILGKTIRINDEPYTIIGVTSAGLPGWWFERPPYGKIELWTPFVPYLTAEEAKREEVNRGNRGYSAIGRLKPGVSIEQAQADLQRIANNLSARYPLDKGVGVALRPLQEDRVGNLRPIVRLLMGAVLLILLIACSNVANMLLAKNSTRTREIAVRVAMGAERSTLTRQFMTENLVLGLLAGLIGCVLAWYGCAAIAHLHPAQLPQLAIVTINSGVLAFGFGISVLSSLVFGSIPLWISLRVNPSEAFKEGGRSNISVRSTRWLKHSFVAGEMALAVMLLIGTGLLIQSLSRLQNQQPGFRVDHLLRTHLFLPPARYGNAASITRFCDKYAARVRELPGVKDVAISAAYPPEDRWTQNFTINGRAVSQLEEVPSAEFNVTDPHYLHTLGISLLKGRDFSDSDNESSQPVVLVNQALVTRYFSLEDPIGKQIRLGLPQSFGGPSRNNYRFTIVGVTANSMNRGLALPPAPQLTALFRQTPDLNYGFKNLIVRTALDPLQLVRPIRQQLHSLDANLPFAEVFSMDQIMSQQTADRRYTTGLLALFAAFGVLLAGVGVYGVVSYIVSQRTNEIGLRMALGAQHSDVLWMVISQGLGMATLGAATGLLGAWVLRRAVAQLVFDISPADPATFLTAAVLLIAFAAAASYIPAWRATKVDPMVALRYE
jgi:putative ABC transport system permease protein